MMDPIPIDTITVSHIEDIIDHQIAVKESGKYQVNILGTTVNGITARIAYEATEIVLDIKQGSELEPDLKRTNYAWPWILISCIATIAVLIVLMVKYIKGKQESNQEMAEPFDGIIEKININLAYIITNVIELLLFYKLFCFN